MTRVEAALAELGSAEWALAELALIDAALVLAALSVVAGIDPALIERTGIAAVITHLVAGPGRGLIAIASVHRTIVHLAAIVRSAAIIVAARLPLGAVFPLDVDAALGALFGLHVGFGLAGEGGQ